MVVNAPKRIINLYSRQYLDTLVLPSLAEGSIWLYKRDHGKKEAVLELIGKQSQWYFVQNDHYHFMQIREPHVRIEDATTYTLVGKKETILLMVSPYCKENQIFQPYVFPEHLSITIGRDAHNLIQYNHPCISMTHATIQHGQDGWRLQDCGSKNGVYVNTLRIQETLLHIGDSIQLMGFILLVGPNCFFLHISSQIHLANCLLPKKIEAIHWKKENKSKLIHGVAENLPSFTKTEYTIDAPPSSLQQEQMPLFYVLGPSMTMGLSSITMGVFSIYQAMHSERDLMQSMPTIIMACSMALGTIVWPLLAKHYERKQHKQQECVRQMRYQEYLQEIQTRIHQEVREQEQYLRACFPTLEELLEILHNEPQKIWSRTVSSPHFLACSMGVGTLPYEPIIHHERSGFQVYKDGLQEAMEDFVKQTYELHKVPYVLPLLESGCVGLVGERCYCEAYLLSMLVQIAIQHSYSEIKIVVIIAEVLARTSGILWLPHLFDEHHKIRFLVCNEQDGKRINAILEDEMEEYANQNRSYLIFSFSMELEKKMPVLKKIRRKEAKGAGVYIQISEDILHLHKECNEVFYVNEQWIQHTNGISLAWHALSKQELLHVHAMANYYLLEHQEFHLPQMFTFLDMYGSGTVEQLNIWHRWTHADPMQSLEVIIGVTSEGEQMVLDAHEKYHGPHGLIAGMTGSGKSECIMTYILSLAINFSPLEVSFLLIDYKGGTMAQTFAQLPHIAGIITNLDEEALQRSLASIKSELTRRQQIFAKTCKEKHRNHLDIYSYQNLRRQDTGLLPMSHLFIIADEFAELKSQQPDFMEQLKQGARIGRSLGVHLILATQKPAGIVDDQIWSNSRFHICLKVQDLGDSQDMLKKEDAAYLKKAGQGYLQIGNDELYEKGLFAFAQGPYEPKEIYKKRGCEEIAIIDHTGQYLIKKEKKRKHHRDGTQLDHMVTHMYALAKRTKSMALPLWEQPISNHLTMDNLIKKYPNITCMIGEIDDMFHQRQYPLQFSLEALQHVLIYGMGNSGKTMFLMALMTSWMKHYESGDVLVFLFDFEDKRLGMFAQHRLIGDVVYYDDKEKVDSFFVQLQKEVRRRKDTSTREIPYVIILHNYENFCTEYSRWEDTIIYLIREGEKYQIYFLITISSLNGVPYRLSQYINKQIIFQMKDSSDYRTILPNEHYLIPQNHKGSGILKMQEVVLFQIASCSEEEIQRCPPASDIELQHRIPVLPEHIRNPALLSRGWYLGKDVKEIEDRYHHFRAPSFMFVFAYHIPTYIHAFHIRHLLDVYPSAYLISIEGIAHGQQNVTQEDFCKQKKGTSNHMYIWKYFPDLAAVYGQAMLSACMLEEGATHLFLDEASRILQYSSYDWFTYHLLDASILWIGKGIQEYSYTLKITQQGLRNDLPANRAYLWEGETCIELQLWEEEANG